MMRRLLPLGLLLLLPACDYIGNPLDGIGSFLSDTISFTTKPNQPVGDAPNMVRVRGEAAPDQPLLPEEGNVWPGPLPPAKTMSDLQRDLGPAPGTGDADAIPRPMPRSAPMAPMTPTPTVPPLRVPPPPKNQPMGAAAPTGRVLQTPAGPAITSVGGNGIEMFTMPTGKTGTVINNGNGTATLIGSDGSTVTVPAR